jgi:hypothetical protein
LVKLYIQTSTNKQFHRDVDLDDTVIYFKMTLEEIIWYRAGFQILFFNDRKLEDGHVLESYGMKANDTLFLQLPEDQPEENPGENAIEIAERDAEPLEREAVPVDDEPKFVHVLVKIPNINSLEVRFDLKSTIKILKEFLERTTDIRFDQQLLKFQGKKLKVHRTVGSYGIKDKEIFDLELLA